ncbi:hypothetical protein A2634_00765 [Candidatus Amesbacteria bacterium RIFCSPHIGHO2_01_FULL_48_32]|uniref:DUF4258 domain-containing protein n=1 Tax=Candidatus Amesbacteria bacterium RIFCSPLOWO2_01_FULL_48_25 TaxID=1797259 RepID=A0A1F4ZBT6_9BACT|nr:MAG: hypothetical protein A2634_00765 [Candidatus Amesbacteria bacterium RIFCSPHIGHO2_01_FULL_48_32]OGD03337.1 MAG: hypothetical protein A2989_00715 [Candidatus Amesbacteria bacterium RIFCSPLOWO2_01_FULL_48_25]HJZ05290.1 hypothetical protein [Patescibacteria group bacterium]
MLVVDSLVWDDWNREHLARHHITPEEVEEVCNGDHQTTESYRKRIMVKGQTKTGKNLSIILSPEDTNLKPYGGGIYYVITAYYE